MRSLKTPTSMALCLPIQVAQGLDRLDDRYRA
jgi:hypothetical protein